MKKKEEINIKNKNKNNKIKKKTIIMWGLVMYVSACMGV